MVDPHIWKQWKVTTAHLEEARRRLLEAAPELAANASPLLSEFDDYLQHNELGLAMEAIAELGYTLPCRGGFWRVLEEAATTMELPDRAARFHEEFLAAPSARMTTNIPMESDRPDTFAMIVDKSTCGYVICATGAGRSWKR